MSYTPHTWENDELITAAKMNNIEEGIAEGGSGALICNAYNDGVHGYVLDKTVQEIYNAINSGTPAYVKFQYGVLGTDYRSEIYLAPIIKIYSYADLGTVRIVASRPSYIGTKDGKTDAFSPSVAIFSASSLSDYPVFYQNIYIPTANVYSNLDM